MVPQHIWCSFLAICNNTRSLNAESISRARILTIPPPVTLAKDPHFYSLTSSSSFPKTSSTANTFLPILLRSIYSDPGWPVSTTIYPAGPTKLKPRLDMPEYDTTTTYITINVPITPTPISSPSDSDSDSPNSDILGQNTNTNTPVPLETLTGIAWEVQSGTTQWIINGTSAPTGWYPSPLPKPVTTQVPGEAGLLTTSLGNMLPYGGTQNGWDTGITLTGTETGAAFSSDGTQIGWSLGITLTGTETGTGTTGGGNAAAMTEDGGSVTIIPGETVTSSRTDATTSSTADEVVYMTISTEILLTIAVTEGEQSVTTSMETKMEPGRAGTTIPRGVAVTVTGNGKEGGKGWGEAIVTIVQGKGEEKDATVTAMAFQVSSTCEGGGRGRFLWMWGFLWLLAAVMEGVR